MTTHYIYICEVDYQECYTMHKFLTSCLMLTIILSSCTNGAPNISVVCEENGVGNCIVKWETSPAIQGYVRVYCSETPDGTPHATPIAGADIADGKLTIVSDNPLKRYYYTLIFNDKYRIKTASRNININGVQNFRDIGGYRSNTLKKNMKWGMVYRSGEIGALDCCAEKELRNIGVKTIIDLRTADEKDTTYTHSWVRQIDAPISVPHMRQALSMIEFGNVTRDTIYELAKIFNREMVSAKNSASYKKIFDTLLQKDNYPVVIQCTTGTGRTGVFFAILMAALNIDDDIITRDYCLSNTYYNITQAKRFGYKLPTNSQEAITVIYTAKEEFLKEAVDEIDRRYGGANKYLRNTIGLTDSDIDKLRSLLLE